MIIAPLPSDEAVRLQTLEAYHILDTPPEEAFDTLAGLAADIVQTPVALVTFIAQERLWFKSCSGVEATETPRDIAFCAHTILSDEIMVVPDATQDERFADNPFVTGEMAVRFYAGVPLITPTGQRLGSLCTIDTTPREGVTPEQAKMLTRLAKLVVDELELRKTLRTATELSDQLAHRAFHDLLTGLPNRAYLQTLLAAEAKKSHPEKSVAMLLIDLDNFKTINDSRGHDVGDQVLVAVSQRLRQAVRGTDTVVRWAGDEFVIVSTALDDAAHAEQMAERVLKSLEQPLCLDRGPLTLSASVGVTVGPAAMFAQEGQVLKQADLALYQAKKVKNTAVVFTGALLTQFTEQYSLEKDLRDAVETSALTLFYQPRVTLSSQRWTSAEALLRWQHPTRGMVSPATFIPVAEKSDLILKLGTFVLDRACEQAARWLAAGTPLRVAVNVSTKQLTQDTFTDLVMTTLERYNLPADLLELEITESAFILDVAKSIATLKELKRRGVHIAMDDFGTGYSSLNTLTQLPLNVLKLDKSFVDRISTEMARQDQAVMELVIALGKSLGLEVVAEGIETTEQHRYLLELGCAQAQGYLFSRPVPAHMLAIPSIEVVH